MQTFDCLNLILRNTVHATVRMYKPIHRMPRDRITLRRVLSVVRDPRSRRTSGGTPFSLHSPSWWLRLSLLSAITAWQPERQYYLFTLYHAELYVNLDLNYFIRSLSGLTRSETSIPHLTIGGSAGMWVSDAFMEYRPAVVSISVKMTGRRHKLLPAVSSWKSHAGKYYLGKLVG